MMNTDKVNAVYEKYAGKSDTNTDKVETEAKVETKAEEVKEETVATGTNQVSDTNTEKDNNEKTPDTAKVETTQPVEKETKVDKKPHYTKQEQIDYAFQKKQAKIKRLEQRNRELEEELKKRDALKLEDFGNDTQKYLDYAVDVKDKQRELARNQEEIKAEQIAEYDELNNKRIAECFPDEKEQKIFKAIIQQNGNAFLQKLDSFDPDGAILSYLDDSDISPLLTRILISSPEYLDEVLSKRSPYGKYNAMDKLAQRVQYAREEMKKRDEAAANNTIPQETEVKTKPSIPVVGSVTKSENTKDSKPVFDPNQILHKLKQKNKYHK